MVESWVLWVVGGVCLAAFVLVWSLASRFADQSEQTHIAVDTFAEQLAEERMAREKMLVKHFESLKSIGAECHAVQVQANEVISRAVGVLERIQTRLD